MAANRIVPNRASTDPGRGRDFFVGVLGFEIAMELDFITTYRTPSGGGQISVLDDPSGIHPDYSVGVDDVEDCHARARDAGHDIVYPLTDEAWGVRRFFVRDPTGAIANIVEHH